MEYARYMTDLTLIADENAYNENFWKRIKERSIILCDRLEKEENMYNSTKEQYQREFDL